MTASVTEQLRRKLGGKWTLDRKFSCWRCEDGRLVYRVFEGCYHLRDVYGIEEPLLGIKTPRKPLFTKCEIEQYMRDAGLRK